jgi:hypothetical protein
VATSQPSVIAAGGPGIWPAFWMLPSEGPPLSSGEGVYGYWPMSGEIDIMESINDMGTTHCALHFGGPGDQHRQVSSKTDAGGGGRLDEVREPDSTIIIVPLPFSKVVVEATPRYSTPLLLGTGRYSPVLVATPRYPPPLLSSVLLANPRYPPPLLPGTGRYSPELPVTGRYSPLLPATGLGP